MRGKPKGVPANPMSLKNDRMNHGYLDALQTWKGLGLNFILIKSSNEYTRMGSEPMNPVGSKPTYIFECVYMHRIGDWILSITVDPFNHLREGFSISHSMIS